MSFNTLSYGQAEADEIISHVKIPGEFLHTPAEEIRSRDWERELRKKTSLELHYVTLAEYHKVKRIPRGLPVSLRPTLFQEKTDYCLKFEGILNKCSMDIILLTIEYLQKEISDLDKQIEVIQQQLCNTLATAKFDSLKQKIDKTIDDFRIILQERKRSKFLRDTEDYHRKTVYKWRDANVQRDRRPFRRDYFTTSSSSEIKRNCTPLEKRALGSLKGNKSITIKPADKGGAIVVMDTSFYMTMVIKTYRERNVIDSKLSEFLLNLHPVIPVFYALPKIHKHLTCPPGRPIVASTNSVLSPLARTVEKILTPLLVHITSFMKDTSDFLKGLGSVGTLPKDCYLVTMDVNSLYTSIDHVKGIEAVQWFLDIYTDFSLTQKDFCLTLLKLILTKKNVLFGDQFFIQKVRTAMGSNVVPPYANIFMASFEEHFVYTHNLF
ncbi:unnamed protein product [Ranitomeya imitator]|uniref:Reverse transcriptase domain-containing protein n=1 Tax=Ranitomeya imitator TaxID=111125 RepID=A0ABN9M4R1_9NEOB|nr:unnamed protein product [Ranitomeya imitator]